MIIFIVEKITFILERQPALFTSLRRPIVRYGIVSSGVSWKGLNFTQLTFIAKIKIYKFFSTGYQTGTQTTVP